jgi:hypothetical protein
MDEEQYEKLKQKLSSNIPGGTPGYHFADYIDLQDDESVLDGRFTSEQLRYIATAMDILKAKDGL